MSEWYEYARKQLADEMAEAELFEDASYIEEWIDRAEDIITDHWDGSEYHCPAHMFGVAAVSLHLANDMELDQKNKMAVWVAGMLHDAGRRNVDDTLNVVVANRIAQRFIADNFTFEDEEIELEFKILVLRGIYGTVYPQRNPITNLAGKILRDADFAATLTPPEVVAEIRQALENEMGVVQTDYEFVVAQGALLPSTVEYYGEHGLDIRLLDN